MCSLYRDRPPGREPSRSRRRSGKANPDSDHAASVILEAREASMKVIRTLTICTIKVAVMIMPMKSSTLFVPQA
jgi:hypothetical protein